MTKTEKSNILEVYKDTFTTYLALKSIESANTEDFKNQLQGIKNVIFALKFDDVELINIENSCMYKGELFTAWQNIHNLFKELNNNYSSYRWTLENLEGMLCNYDIYADTEQYKNILKHEEYIKRLIAEKEQNERSIDNLIKSMIAQ